MVFFVHRLAADDRLRHYAAHPEFIPFPVPATNACVFVEAFWQQNGLTTGPKSFWAGIGLP